MLIWRLNNILRNQLLTCNTRATMYERRKTASIRSDLYQERHGLYHCGGAGLRTPN